MCRKTTGNKNLKVVTIINGRITLLPECAEFDCKKLTFIED